MDKKQRNYKLGKIEVNMTNKMFYLLIVLGIFMFGGIGYVIANTLISDTQITSGGNITLPLNKHIKLYGDNDTWHYRNGSAIEFHMTETAAKPYLGWYADYNETPYLVGWIGCHKDAISGGGAHQHCQIETRDSDIGYPEGKIEASYDTYRNQSYVGVSNVAEFRLGASMDHMRIKSADILYEGQQFDIHTANDTTKGLRLGNNSDSVTLRGLGSDELYFLSDLNIQDDEVLIDNTADAWFVADRGVNTNDAGYRIRTNGTTLWSMYVDDASNDLEFRMNMYAKDRMILKRYGEMQLFTNSSAVTCNVANAGSIYWDNSTKKHYGCNSTDWNALY